MQAVIITVHILVCFALIGIVLLQQGKGAEMGAVFGGSSQTLFGSSGATTLLGKATAGAAVIFMLTSLSLTYRAANRYKSSVMADQPAASAPVVPAPQSSPSSAASEPEQAAAPAAQSPAEAEPAAQPPTEAEPAAQPTPQPSSE